jgi:hypothetical protein
MSTFEKIVVVELGMLIFVVAGTALVTESWFNKFESILKNIEKKLR